MSSTIRGTLTVALAAGAVLLLPLDAWAQETGLGTQTLRGHWHVFIAYAVAWVLVFGWLVSVFRRMGRLDRDLNGG